MLEAIILIVKELAPPLDQEGAPTGANEGELLSGGVNIIQQRRKKKKRCMVAHQGGWHFLCLAGGGIG